jgi:hypothetical protein
MKISHLSLTALLLGALLLPGTVLAQTAAPKEGEVTVIATVNIYNAKIVSQSGRTLTIAFDLSNREGIQSGVRYSAYLAQSVPTGGMIVDKKVYDEVLTLGAGATIHKEITYTVPDYISGTYDLWIESESTNGLPLASMILGKATLSECGRLGFNRSVLMLLDHQRR